MLDYMPFNFFRQTGTFCNKLIVDPTNLVQFRDESTVNLLPAESQASRYFKLQGIEWYRAKNKDE